MTDSDRLAKILEATSGMTSGEDLLQFSRSALPVEPSYSGEDSIELAGRLDWSPRENWIDQNGSLPKYIEDVAIGIMKGSGKPRELAIPIAISRIKRWAAGLDGVKADTVAKSALALAQWEKLKAKAAARRASKK